MKSYLSLSWKELKAQKVTSVLILIAIILSTIATTAIGQSIGILQSMRVRQAAGLNGDRYATFHQLTQEQNDILFSDTRLKEVDTWVTVGNMDLEGSGLTLFLREYHGTALENYQDLGVIKEGPLPKREGELALSEETLQYLGFTGRLGDAMTLSLKVSQLIDDQPPYEYTADFVLTGILQNNYLGYATGTVSGVVGEGTAQDLLPERYMCYSTDFKTVSVKNFQSVVNDLMKKLDVTEPYLQYNWVLLDALGVDYAEKGSADTAEGFPFMMAACILVGALILLAAGLVIYNILKVAVAKRIREYGTLRAIGGERSQIYAMVTVQLVMLCGIGLPPGMRLGILSAKGILMAATGMLNPDLFMVQSEQELNTAIAESSTGGALPLFVSVLVTLLFAVLAAFPSARYASHVSPTVAMSGQAVHVRRRNRKQKKIQNFEAFYARLNLKRNRSRTVITILSMVMSITVFVALQSFGSLLDASRSVQQMHMGDYAITNETIGIPEQSVLQVAESKMVEGLSTTKLTVYSKDDNGDMPVDLDLSLQSGESFQIAAVNDLRLGSFKPDLCREDLEELVNGTACLVKNPFPFSYEGQEIARTELYQNDKITVNGKQLRVAGVVDVPVYINNAGFTNGVQIIVADALYDVLVENTGYSEIYPVLSEGADSEAFEEWLDQWCKENPGSHWLSYRQLDAQLSESFEQIRLLCWGLILFIGLIGILNIVNTVYTNIHTRINEIGMQRALGMSACSLYKTFLWEGIYYGVIASVVGAVCGYICTIFVEAAANNSLQFTAVPVISIMEAAIVSVSACLIATAIPLRAIGKLSIVDSIGEIS